MTTKSLRPEQNERLRGIVRELIDKDFKGNATAAAKAVGVAQGLMSEFLSGDAWWVTVHLALPENRLGEANPHLTPYFQALFEEAHDSITFVMMTA